MQQGHGAEVQAPRSSAGVGVQWAEVLIFKAGDGYRGRRQSLSSGIWRVEMVEQPGGGIRLWRRGLRLATAMGMGQRWWPLRLVMDIEGGAKV